MWHVAFIDLRYIYTRVFWSYWSLLVLSFALPSYVVLNAIECLTFNK